MNGAQFKIEKKISESATTVVYRAFDDVLHRTVLLKVLHKHLANDEDIKERFVREARACAALHSEHIVRIYDLTVIDGSPAIVMEYVDGESLKELLAKTQNDRISLAKKVAVHILRALSVAHRRGIIHRDIKPGNILVAQNGTIKVTDFGLAAVALSPTVTQEGMVLGTPAYMAPEQVRGDVSDSRTDLFALGVTLIEILSGERIFEGSTYTECMRKVLAFRMSDISRFEAMSDSAHWPLIQRLLQPDMKDRFSSAEEALNLIDDKKSSDIIAPPEKTKNNQRIYIGAFVGLTVILFFAWFTIKNNGNNSESAEFSPALETAAIDTIEAHQPENQPVTDKPVLSAKNIESATPEIRTPVSIVKTDSGKIFLTSTPWAKVFINHQLIGETPIAKPVLLAAGKHTVMFTNPTFDPLVKEIMVEANREIVVDGNFLETAGYLMCIVSPWAEIYIDEQYKDTTPLSKPIIVSAGVHTIRFSNSTFTDIIKEIDIRPKDTARISVTFTR